MGGINFSVLRLFYSGSCMLADAEIAQHEKSNQKWHLNPVTTEITKAIGILQFVF